MPWEDMHPGCSVFLKTTASIGMVKKELRRVTPFLQMEFQTAYRVEFGYYGVRVWRI